MLKKHPFLPVIDSQCKILILGSMPSLRSTEEGFYYMHPQNRFWKVLSEIFLFDFLSSNIEKRKSKLLELHIALYDIIAECDIEASKDSSITNAIPQDIRELINGTRIKQILFNGKTAYQVFMKNYPELKEMAVLLPSTSSANATCSLNRLIEEWKKYLKE